MSRVVTEAGHDGRLDGTNVPNAPAPVLVITIVSLEHADVIGPNVQDITYEIAGNIKPGVIQVIGMRPV